MAMTIEKKVELKAPPDRVWRAITDPAEIAQWFGDSAEFDLTPGSEGWFGWAKHGRFAMRIENIDAPRRIAWRWMAHSPDEGFSEDGSTLVEWVLTPLENGGTLLELRESGFKTEEHVKDNTRGWDSELADLRKLLAA